jgi:hypothetical protein
LVGTGNSSALDVDLIESMVEMDRRNPEARVMLERVCAWKAGDLAGYSTVNPQSLKALDAAEEDLDVRRIPKSAICVA